MKAFVLSTLSASLDTVRLLHEEVPIAGVIGLTPMAERRGVAGYLNHEPYARQLGLPWVGVKTYGLSDPDDQRALSALQIDILLVLGWQRLIPEWLIAHCAIGAIGVHGSAEGITKGRGRSPQNWALLLGQEEFSVSLFWINAGIDSGPVIDTKSFSLSQFDDIGSSQLKTCWLTAEMIRSLVNDASQLRDSKGTRQGADARYLPRRRAEDGQIDWRRSTRELCDFVRALTHPYPGAWTTIDGSQRLSIWRVRPFDMHGPEEEAPPGSVLYQSASGALLVQTGDGILLLDEYEWDRTPADSELTSAVFTSIRFQEQLRYIIARHEEIHPDLPISDHMAKLASAGHVDERAERE